MYECVRKSVVLRDWGQRGKKKKITRTLLLILLHVVFQRLIEIIAFIT